MAKKRREQEPGPRLAKCSPTVAVTQQSWRSGNHYLGLFRAAALPGPAVGSPVPPIGHNMGHRQRRFSNARIASHGYRATDGNSAGLRVARIAQHDSHDICSANLSIAAIAHSDVRAANVHRARNGSRHFCAAGTFCASFRHAMTPSATCVPRAESPFIQGRTTSCATCRRRF